jgi:hypothetical protein
MSDLDEHSGLTPLDIADLPDEQRQVMVSFLRDAKETAGILTFDALQDKHKDLDDLSDVLADLTKSNWLIRLGEEPHVRYKVNFRRRRASRLANDLWATLSEDDNADSEPPSDDAQANDRPSLPSLSDW